MELLVVISLVVLLMAIAVPAVSSILRSTEQASARNQLDAALSTARSVAVTSESGQDTAAVFFFKPGGRLTIGVFRKAGEIQDVDANNNPTVRDIFVPTGQQAFSLPPGWMVRGLAPIGTLHDPLSDPSGWYESESERQFEMGSGSGRPWWNWIFPETGFFDPKKAKDESAGPGTSSRQTFMIRFESGTGMVKTGDRRMALVVEPSPSNAFRTQLPYRYYRFNRGDDVATVVEQILKTRDSDLSHTDKLKLLGDQASDTVLALGVTEIAMYREVDLAAALGARGLNRATGSLYGDDGKTAIRPQLDSKLFASYDAQQAAKDINDWFGADADDPDSEPGSGGAFVFTVDRSSGRPTEVRR